MAIYQPTINRPVSVDHDRLRFTDTAVLSGTDQQLLVAKGIFFLEYLESSAGVTVKDGDGNTVVSSLTDFRSDRSPIRLDHGIIITGTVIIAKGYIASNVFQE